MNTAPHHIPSVQKTKFRPHWPRRLAFLLGMGCVWAAAISSFAATRLNIAYTNGQVVLSWQGDGFVLQSAQNLNVPILWSTSALPLVVSGTNYSTTTQPSNSAAFYRLISTNASGGVSGLVLVPEESALFANWDSAPGATNYNLYLAATNGVAPTNYSTLPGGQKISGISPPYFIGSLSNGVRYYAVVTGQGGSGESPPSTEASAVFGPHAEVSGSIFLNVGAGTGQTNSVFIPGVQVWLMNTSNGVTTAAAPTDLNGSFTFSRQPAGTYTLCYTLSNSFPACGTVCSTQQIVVGNQALSLSPQAFTSVCAVVYGRVMLDGKVAFPDTDPFFGYDIRAQVKLVNGSGQTNTAPVNESGEFVFLGMPPGSYVLSADCEGAHVQQNIVLPETNAFVLTLPGHVPILRNAFIQDPVSGVEIFQALPGATVRVVVDAIDPDGDALTYDWIPGAGSSDGFQSTNAPSVLWQFPNGNGVHIMYFAVRDHKGGVQTGKLAINTDPFVLFTGTVSKNGAPPTNITFVIINGQTNSIDASGYFSLQVTNLSSNYVVTIESEGSEPITKVFDQQAVGLFYPLRQSYEVLFNFTDAPGVTVTNGGMSIYFPRGSILSAFGPVYNGIIVTFSLIDPADPQGQFPGNLNRIAGDPNDELVPYAGISVALRRAILPSLKDGIAKDNGPDTRLFIDRFLPPVVTVPVGNTFPLTNTLVPVWRFVGDRYQAYGVFATNSGFSTLRWAIDSAGVSVAATTNLTGASITLEIADSIDLPVDVTVSSPVAQTVTVTKRFTAFNHLPPAQEMKFVIRQANELMLSNNCVISNSVVTGSAGTSNYVRLAFPCVPEPKKLLASTIGPGTNTYGEEYYKNIDPNDTKRYFDNWKLANGFTLAPDAGADAEAIYFNNGDLGFGRWMGMKTNANGDIAYYVSNYRTADDAINARKNGYYIGLLATVCMEYSAHPKENPNRRYTKFYVFDRQGIRRPGVELDGRGEKYVPHLCMVCHGGNNPGLDIAKIGSGDVRSKFLPFDLESFKYSKDSNFTLAAQSAAFKVLNTTALRAASTPSITELVQGWYGGPSYPGNYNKDFIPANWNGTPASRELYSKVFKVSCRSCHIAQEKRPFSEFGDLKNYDDERMKGYICKPTSSMPNALRTFNIFWSSQCSATNQPLLLQTNVGFECPACP